MAAAATAGIARVVHLSSDSVLQDGQALRNVSENIPCPSAPPVPIPQASQRLRGSR